MYNVKYYFYILILPSSLKSVNLSYRNRDNYKIQKFNLYALYKNWGWASIPQMPENKKPFNRIELDLMDKVYKVYGYYTGDELESFIHIKQHNR